MERGQPDVRFAVQLLDLENALTRECPQRKLAVQKNRIHTGSFLSLLIECVVLDLNNIERPLPYEVVGYRQTT
jgi:hypothetical protein